MYGRQSGVRGCLRVSPLMDVESHQSSPVIDSDCSLLITQLCRRKQQSAVVLFMSPSSSADASFSSFHKKGRSVGVKESNSSVGRPTPYRSRPESIRVAQKNAAVAGTSAAGAGQAQMRH